MNRKLIFLGLGLFSIDTAVSQERMSLSRDSSYNNSYYIEKDKLYKELISTKYDVLFFGNSITERGPWQELIGDKYKVGNRGIGGDNTFGMKARIKDAIASKPKKIFLMMGINDIARGLPMTWSLANYEDIIKTILKNSPKTQIYIQSTLPLNEKELRYDYLQGKEQLIRDLNRKIMELASTYKLPYVDVKAVLADDYTLKKEYTTDGIHINTDAYIKWVGYLKENKYL